MVVTNGISDTFFTVIRVWTVADFTRTVAVASAGVGTTSKSIICEATSLVTDAHAAVPYGVGCALCALPVFWSCADVTGTWADADVVTALSAVALVACTDTCAVDVGSSSGFAI